MSASSPSITHLLCGLGRSKDTSLLHCAEVSESMPIQASADVLELASGFQIRLMPHLVGLGKSAGSQITKWGAKEPDIIILSKGGEIHPYGVKPGQSLHDSEVLFGGHK